MLGAANDVQLPGTNVETGERVVTAVSVAKPVPMVPLHFLTVVALEVTVEVQLRVNFSVVGPLVVAATDSVA